MALFGEKPGVEILNTLFPFTKMLPDDELYGYKIILDDIPRILEIEVSSREYRLNSTDWRRGFLALRALLSSNPNKSEAA